MSDSSAQSADPLAMFLDEDFNPSNYVDALFKSEAATDPYSKENMLKLTNLSNNLIIQFNFYLNQLNEEINKNFARLNKAVIEQNLNNSTRLNYFVDSLNNSVLRLSSSIGELTQFHQLVSINKLVSFKTVKSNITATLNNLKFIEVNLGGELSAEKFEANLNNLYQKITQIQSKPDRLSNAEKLVDSQVLFQNFNNFNSIYKKNASKFSAERDSLK